jgi:DNA-3-methyladenine glycosylase II
MNRVINDSLAAEAADYLSKTDKILRPIIKQAGPCTIRPHKNYYWELVDSIISQQLSVKAAASIERRFQELFNSEFPKPEQILDSPDDSLRSVGLSRPKVGYIKNLAEHIVSGQLVPSKLGELEDSEIIEKLTAVKGIGEWTAHMFLMFCMARVNILPTGDLGIVNSIKQLYGFDHKPTALEIKQLAEDNRWAPYETIASWYIWQNLGNKPSL